MGNAWTSQPEAVLAVVRSCSRLINRCTSRLPSCCSSACSLFFHLLCWPFCCCWLFVQYVKWKRNQDQNYMNSLCPCWSFFEYMNPLRRRDHAQSDSESDYEQGYIDRRDNIKNYLFFTNKISSKPNGDYIDNIHEQWWYDYHLLERHHGFIQWLFPLPEPGVNSEAQVLYPHEIDMIKADQEAKNRLLKSYKMMLGFYGFELVDENTGEVTRTSDYNERFENLNRNTHNNLRISRILRCLRLLGFEHLQYPLLQGFLREILLEGTLTRCRNSCFDFWIGTLSEDDSARIWQYHDECLNKKENDESQKKEVLLDLDSADTTEDAVKTEDDIGLMPAATTEEQMYSSASSRNHQESDSTNDNQKI